MPLRPAALLWLCLATFAAPAAAQEVISAPEAKRMAEAGEAILVDIRTPEEWRQTGIPEGAALVNLKHPGGAKGFAEDVLKAAGGDPNRPVALICRTGNRSTLAAKVLRASGFSNVYNVKEGMAGSEAGPGWIKRGLPREPCPC